MREREGGEGEGGWGTMSYPNHGGPDKHLQKPDLYTLASIAEAAGVDLRIVLLVE